MGSIQWRSLLTTIRPLVNPEWIERFRNLAMTPERPDTRGTAENPETFFTHREACNKYYEIGRASCRERV